MREPTTKLGNEILTLLQAMDLSDTIYEGITLYTESGDRQAMTFLSSALHAVENAAISLDAEVGKKLQDASRILLKKKDLFVFEPGVEQGLSPRLRTGRMYPCRNLSGCSLNG